MPFNTAIFYDIENLLKGYAFSAQTLANLSLREILESVRKTGRLSAIAVQRAYANWSDPRLGVMRGEINELGIEPVQVFGFSRDQKKNAADIQLAIDAVDLAHIRPSIEVFVIVSGDGGFASLAKKLHEYGKVVIGCAYTSAANRVFQAICDEFVPIPDPEDRSDRESTSTLQGLGEEPQITTPLVVRMARAIRRVGTGDRQAVIAKAKEILHWLENDEEAQRDLSGQGLHLSVVSEAIRHAVHDFEASRVGFAKFVELLQYLCAGTKLCVFRSSGGAVVLATRSNARLAAEALPDLSSDFVHSVENYRSLLATGLPIFRLPAPADLSRVAAWIAEVSPHNVELGTIIETATGALGSAVSSEATKRALLCFISAGVFDRQPDGLPLSEQKLALKFTMRTPAQILGALGLAARAKLTAALGEVQDEFLNELLPADA
ncbi:NYN domain-containing protein [Synechococcus sp. OH2]|uniref:NYN domain-containing protein n=1 Tax=Synechococcus sp. OH2 TaxID=136798 RepID=UPI0039C2D4F5